MCYNTATDTNLCLMSEKGMRHMSENRIRGIVLGCYPSITAFAEKVGWARQKASNIIGGKQEPSLEDCCVIAKAVGKEADEIASIFLQAKTQKCV